MCVALLSEAGVDTVRLTDKDCVCRQQTIIKTYKTLQESHFKTEVRFRVPSSPSPVAEANIDTEIWKRSRKYLYRHLSPRIIYYNPALEKRVIKSDINMTEPEYNI